MASAKKSGQVMCGFALETDHEMEHASAKLERKHLDAIVLNSLRDKGAGFGTDTNKVTIVTSAGKEYRSGLKSKADVAADILDVLAGL